MNSLFVVAAVLYFLAMVDCAFASYRSAGGRNSLIHKGNYCLRACLRGALWANIPVAIAAVLAFSIYQGAGRSEQMLNDYFIAGLRMLCVYLPYAALVGVALWIRCIPSVDARTMSQVVVLGPMTFARNVVAVAGMIYAATGVKHIEVMLAIVPIVLMMLMMQPFFDKINRYPDFKQRQSLS